MARNSANAPARSPRKSVRTTASTFTQKHAKTILAPLSRREATAAIKLALEVLARDQSIRRDRLRIYEPQLRIEKAKQRDGTPSRQIWVRLRDRDQGLVHEVSIEAGQVVQYAIDPNAKPPFSQEERNDARQVITNDPEFAEITGRADIDFEWFNPDSHDQGRVIGVRLVRVEQHQVVEVLAEAEVELDNAVRHERRHP